MKRWKKLLRDLAPRLVRIADAVRDERAATRTPRPTKHGFKLAGSASMEAGTFEAQETRLLGEFMRDADVFVNVGANVGYYCCQALQLGLYTVAIEPLPLNVRLLMANVRANGWERQVEIHPVALAQENGILELFGSGTGASLIAGWSNNTGNGGVLVPVLRLDDVLGSRFLGKRLLVVMDVEGVEARVLEGAMETLARTPAPIWMVEISIDEHHAEGARVNPTLLATFDHFWRHGYTAWTCAEPSRRIEPVEIQAIAQSGVSTIAVHNFVFRKDE